MAKRIIDYQYLIRKEGGSGWLDITGFVNSQDTSITNDLCTKQFKSVTNKASFKVRYTGKLANGLSYSSLLDSILSAREQGIRTEVQIVDRTGTSPVVLFDGYLDDSDISIASSMIPDNIEISASDRITDLDTKIASNIVYHKDDYAPNGISVNALVVNLLSLAGYTGSLESDIPDDRCMPYFVVTEDDGVTIRDVIDTLLFECAGFVLYRDPATSMYSIRAIHTKAEGTPRQVHYKVSDKLQTKNAISDNDGIIVKYPTVETKTGTSVYTSDISFEYVEDLQEYHGQLVPTGDYYPENGDVQATFQEYETDLLDKPYQEGTSRLQNSDLDLLYVRNAQVKISATGEFEYPVLAGIDMVANPAFFPRKAQVLLHNNTSRGLYVDTFTIEGDATYKARINKITLPSSCKNPEEYETSYIFSESEAEDFAKFYYKFKKISSSYSTWTEPENQASHIGEVVNVLHKNSPVGQAHVVVSITNAGLSQRIRTYKVVAVAISEYNEYDYLKTSSLPNSSNKKGIVSDSNEYYASTSSTELVGGTWQDKIAIEGNEKTIWVRRKVIYTDGSRYVSDAYPSGSQGKDGASGTYLSLDATRSVVEYYADGVIVDSSDITIKAESDLAIVLSVNGSVVENTGALAVEYTLSPASLLNNNNEIRIVASTSRMQQSLTIRKSILTGSLSLEADKTSIAFYADNVPHTENDSIALTVTSSGYGNYPKLYIDGALVETQSSDSYTYSLSYTKFLSKNSVTAVVKAGSDSQTITLYKAMDSGSMNITASGDSFQYYADDRPHNNTDFITLSISQSGYSAMPTLTLNGEVKEYTAGKYIVYSTAMASSDRIYATISNSVESNSVTINKAKDAPHISLTLSDGVAEYYADNVAITGDIIATVSYSGLFFQPLLRAGNTAIALDSTTGKGTIPISLFDGDISGLNITAYAQKVISYSTTVNVPKQKLPLALSIGLSSAQFSFDSAGNVSPSTIELTNNTYGLSDKSKVVLVVGGSIVSWDSEGKYTLTPDMITGRYIAITASYGTDATSAIVTKTFDGKGEIVEYSKTRSFYIYPADEGEYEFIFNEEHLVYNGETMVWLIPWTTTMPDCASDEYVWRRSRTSDSEPWSYTRMTGVKGNDGKAGVYLGAYASEPTARPDGEALLEGDFYLNISEAGNPKPYILKDKVWTLVTADDKNWSYIASATMDDVNNYGGSLLSTSAYYGFFQALAAQTAFIKSLGVQELTLSENGAIQSENYLSTGGAEGFRIEADGDVDFNNGVWRGAFSNGFSFVPPTSFKIDKTMTQREAYRVMRRAGVHSGRFVQYSREYAPPYTMHQGQTRYGMSPAYPSFTCLDYDESKSDMAVPLQIGRFSEVTVGGKTANVIQLLTDETRFIGSIIPFDIDKWIVEVNQLNSGKTGFTHLGYYLVTKNSLETAFTSNLPASTGPSSLSIPMTKIDSMDYVYCFVNVVYDEVDTTVCSVDVLNHLYVSPDGGVMIGLDANGNAHRFSYSSASGNIVDDGAITISGVTLASGESMMFIRNVLPIIYSHDYDGTGRVFSACTILSGKFNRVLYLKTTDYKSFSLVGEVSVSSMSASDSNFFLLDSVKLSDGGHIAVCQRTDASDSKAYAMVMRYDSSSAAWSELGRIRVPNSSVSNAYVIGSSGKQKISTNISYCNMYVQGDYVLISVCGHNLYRYRMSDNTLDNITGILTRFLPTLTITPYGYNEFMASLYATAKDFYDQYIPSETIEAMEYDKSVGKVLLMTRYGNGSIMGNGISTLFYLDIDTLEVTQFAPLIFKPLGSASFIRYPNSFPMITKEDGRATYADYGTIYLKRQSLRHLGYYIRNRKASEYRLYCQEHANKISAEWFLNGSTEYPAGLYQLIAYDAESIGRTIHDNVTSAEMSDIVKPYDYVDHNAGLLVAYNDDNLLVASPYPVMNCPVVDVRDSGGSYEICLASIEMARSIYDYPSSLGMFSATYFGQIIEMRGGVKTLPFLTIDKDSDELVGATFYWNFPAQIILDDSIQHIESTFLPTIQ